METKVEPYSSIQGSLHACKQASEVEVLSLILLEKLKNEKGKYDVWFWRESFESMWFQVLFYSQAFVGCRFLEATSFPALFLTFLSSPIQSNLLGLISMMTSVHCHMLLFVVNQKKKKNKNDAVVF